MTPMTPLQFLASPTFGCCTTGELLQLGKVDRAGLDRLKQWAIEEMAKREIPLKESV